MLNFKYIGYELYAYILCSFAVDKLVLVGEDKC